MADSRYGPSVSNSQSRNEASSEKAAWDRARLDAELESLDRALASTRDAAEELHSLAKALILRSLSEPMVDLAERFNKLDKVDLVGELRGFLECAYLGAQGLGSPHERDGLQTVLSHVMYGLKALSQSLHPDRAEAQAV
jgi:hypothetical protein